MLGAELSGSGGGGRSTSGTSGGVGGRALGLESSPALTGDSIEGRSPLLAGNLLRREDELDDFTGGLPIDDITILNALGGLLHETSNSLVRDHFVLVEVLEGANELASVELTVTVAVAVDAEAEAHGGIVPVLVVVLTVVVVGFPAGVSDASDEAGPFFAGGTSALHGDLHALTSELERDLDAVESAHHFLEALPVLSFNEIFDSSIEALAELAGHESLVAIGIAGLGLLDAHVVGHKTGEIDVFTKGVNELHGDDASFDALMEAGGELKEGEHTVLLTMRVEAVVDTHGLPFPVLKVGHVGGGGGSGLLVGGALVDLDGKGRGSEKRSDEGLHCL